MTRNETDTGTTTFGFDVSVSVLPGLGASPITVNYTTVDGTATVTDSDYVAAAGTLTFNAGTSSVQRVNITVNGDTKFEPNEVFIVRLSNPSNASIIEFDGIGTIFNDDVEPRFSVGSVAANEGNAGTTPFVFTLTRTGNPTAFSSVVAYATANGTATAPGDYAAATGTVTFAPGETAKTVTVNVVGDTVEEPNETFTMTITSVTNGVVGTATGTATIINDEGVPMVGVEGDVVDGSGGAAGDGLVQANDVTAVRNFILGSATPVTSPNQYQRSDVNLPCGNGQIDSGDVTVIRNMILGTVPNNTQACGPTGPSGGNAPLSLDPSEPSPRFVRIGDVKGARPGQTVTVPIVLDSRGDEASLSFAASWDPKILTYVSAAIGNGVPAGTNFATNTSRTKEGSLGVLLDSTTTYGPGPRQIMTITFVVAADSSIGTYPISFSPTVTSRSVANAQGALLTATYEQGNIVVGPTAAGISVSGRVLNTSGKGLRNATVVITDRIGNRRTASTGSFGYYLFEGLDAGQSYVLGVTARRYRAATRSINLSESLDGLNFFLLE